MLVELVQCHLVTVEVTGSSPVHSAKSKRYSQSLVTFFINVIADASHGLIEEVVGIKRLTQSIPVVLALFMRDASQVL